MAIGATEARAQPGSAARDLACASAAALGLELALIRWLPGEVRVAAYFPNVVLLASFLGLGVGALWRRASLAASGVALLVLAAAAVLMSRVAFTATDASEHLWLLYFDLPQDAPVVHSIAWPVFALFLLSALPFVGFGGAIASRLGEFQRDGRTLPGYAIDLGGSLCGVIVFLGLAAVGARPIVWFSVPLALALLVTQRIAGRLVLAGSGAAVLLLVGMTDKADTYSPYYALRVIEREDGFSLLANGSLHQRALDLRAEAAVDPDSYTAIARPGYRLPLLNLSKPPARALVLGAGTGNDVAILLEAGVPEVHAVEIDPGIVEIGRQRHPCRPYDDPRVTVHVNDARSFLETTNLTFDYIVFGTLDSMTRLSALSNVRLDNFVYTRECIAAARARLSERGGLALFFMVASPAIDDHLFAIMDEAFGKPPLCWSEYYRLFNRIYMAGPGFAHLEGRPEFIDADRMARRAELVAPDDDWPYLYLTKRGVPGFYLGLIGLVLIAAVGSVLAVSRTLRRDALSGVVDMEMALFGAAFLLLEASFVTDMNLVFGATWKTSAVVFAAILATVLAATLLASRVKIPAAPALIAVAIVLGMLAFIPLRTIAPTSAALRIPFAVAVCGTPVFFAALAFAARFGRRASVETAFGWNLLGAVVGGLLEFSSMAIGLRALFLVAAGLYLAVLWMALRAERPRLTSTAEGV